MNNAEIEQLKNRIAFLEVRQKKMEDAIKALYDICKQLFYQQLDVNKKILMNSEKDNLFSNLIDFLL